MCKYIFIGPGIFSILCRDIDGKQLNDYLAIDNIDRVWISFEYYNNVTDDAFDSFLSFTIPRLYYENAAVFSASVSVYCVYMLVFILIAFFNKM